MGIYSVFVVVSYLLGAIPFGLLVGLAKGVDIRQHGSGTTGATNALRSIGWKLSGIVLVLDVLKAVLPVLVARMIFADTALEVACGVAAVVGHNWPVYIGFKGGKGVSSSLGVMLVLLPVPTAVAAILCIGLIAWTRYVSLGSVAGAIVVPLAAIFYDLAVQPLPIVLVAGTGLLGALIIVRHRGNIKRLLAGNERKLGHRAI